MKILQVYSSVHIPTSTYKCTNHQIFVVQSSLLWLSFFMIHTIFIHIFVNLLISDPHPHPSHCMLHLQEFSHPLSGLMGFQSVIIKQCEILHGSIPFTTHLNFNRKTDNICEKDLRRIDLIWMSKHHAYNRRQRLMSLNHHFHVLCVILTVVLETTHRTHPVNRM